MIGFILGAMAGGAAVWLWREEIRTYMERARSRTADQLQALEKTTEEVIDRAKPRIVSTLRAGREAIQRPPGSPGSTAGFGESESRQTGFTQSGPTGRSG